MLKIMKKQPRTAGNFYLYQHIRLDTNEIFYIGIGGKRRPYDIKNRSKWWKNIVNKTKYDVQVLYENLTREEACELEKNLISFYGRRDLNKGTLVNMTDGGDGVSGIKRSIETREKIRQGHLGKILSEEQKEKIRQYNLGKKLSEETKNKISLNTRGSNNHKSRKIIDIITLEIFDSVTSAANSIGMKRDTLFGQLRYYKNKTNLRYYEEPKD